MNMFYEDDKVCDPRVFQECSVTFSCCSCVQKTKMHIKGYRTCVSVVQVQAGGHLQPRVVFDMHHNKLSCYLRHEPTWQEARAGIWHHVGIANDLVCQQHPFKTSMTQRFKKAFLFVLQLRVLL